MYFSHFTAVVFCAISTVALAADPAKDPGGWAGVKFGMNPDEVLKALGPDGYVEASPEDNRLPFNIDETVDIPAAMTFAKETVASAKADAASVPEDLLGACKELLAKSKAFVWVFSDSQSDSSGRAQPAKRVSGSLEKITSYGAKHIGHYQRTMHIKTARAILLLPEARLDPGSKKRLVEIEGAILDIANAMRRREEAERLRRGEGRPIATPANRVRVRPTKIRGIEIVPKLTFDGEKVRRIYLQVQYEGEIGFQFDETGMQQTFVEALSEKFGPHDERNRTSNGQEYLWRFPSTVIRCSAGRATFPGSSFVRKYASITYEEPSQENAASKDRL